MKNTNKMLMMAACTLLLVMGTSIIPMQSFADRGDYKDEKGNDLKSKLSAIAESDIKERRSRNGPRQPLLQGRRL